MEMSYYKSLEPFWGSWRISKMLGEGSFGKVFEIEREDFGRTYKAALKVITIPQSESELKSVMSDGMDAESATSYYKSFVGEVVDEFAMMSGLKGNSNIVSYEDHTVVEHKDGIGWDILIRMELLTPLLDYATTERPMGRNDVIKLGIDICKALECCQRQNIIHRDIKPENIFVSPNGDYKLGDFGIARTVEKTTSGLSRKGTYTYMAPEVYKGEEYGSSVDIYSLGIVLYRLLNNNRAPFLPPFPAPITHSDRENSIARRVGGEPLPAPALAEPQLAGIILKACAYLPQNRYVSPEAMRADLEAALTAQPQSPFQVNPAAGHVTETTAQNPALQAQRSTWEQPMWGQPQPTSTQQPTWGQPQQTPTQQPVWGETSQGGQPWGQPQAPEQTAWGQPSQPQAMPEGDNTVFLFGDGGSRQGVPGGQPADSQQPPVQEEPVPAAPPKKEKKEKKAKKKAENKQETGEKKKGKKNILIIIALVVVAVIGIIIALVVLPGGSVAPDNYTGFSYLDEDHGDIGVTVPSESIDLSNKLLFGDYYVNESRATALNPDSNPLEFLEGMEFTEIDGENVSVLPFEMHCWDDGGLSTNGIPFNSPLEAIEEKYDVYMHARSKELGVEKAAFFKEIVTALFGEQAAGQAEDFYKENIAGQRDYAVMTFLDQRQNEKVLYGCYKAEGSVMDFGYLKLDGSGQLTMETMEFGVRVAGRNLEFTRSGINRDLVPYGYAYNSSAGFVSNSIYGYVSSAEDAYKDIVSIGLYHMDSEEPNVYIDFADGDIAASPVMELSDGGHTITLRWEGKAEGKNIDGSYRGMIGEPDSITFQYLLCGNMGFVLRADGQNYCYQRTRDEYYADILDDSLQEVKAQDLKEMSDDSLKQVAIVQKDILEALQAAYAAAGIEVEIDEQSGKITMSDSILFGLDSAELSGEGKDYLDRFLKVYADVVLDEGSDYYDYIDAILLEGHTDSSGDYAYNQQLSEARAEAVDDYCYELYPSLSNYIDTAGRASDDLIYDENGEEDREASRRVTFKILLDLEAFGAGHTESE